MLFVLFIFVSLASYYGIEKIELQNYKERLSKELVLVEEILKAKGLSDRLVKELDSKIGSRITIVDRTGRVVAESRYDKERMENHLSRPEIQEALRKGMGSSQRYSHTLEQRLLYVAKLWDEKVVRLAYPLKAIERDFLGLWLKFVSIFSLFLLGSLGIAYLVSVKIKQEIDGISAYVERLAKKEYEGFFRATFAKEFDEIAQNIAKLAKKLKKREEKKEKFTKKIKQLSRQRNELISAVSHEFKNPIAIINGYAQTLLDDPDMPPNLRRRFIEKIYNASQKISYMIDRLAFAMKMESAKLSLQKSSVDLCEIVREAVHFIQERYKERRITIECSPCKVEVDRQMMVVVIENLLDNALKYSEAEVIVRSKDGRVEVIDRGIGLKPEEIGKITKKFYRVHNSWDNSMGLGLYIVSYILELHGSRLEIESRYGKGSVFGFSLV